MCPTFPCPLTVEAVVGGYPNAPPDGAMQRPAVPAPTPGRPYAPCREFDPDIAAAIAVAHFGGRRTLRVLQR